MITAQEISSAVPCAGQPRLFDSLRLCNHHEAARLCATCPGRASCQAAARDEKGTGTYGGVLYRDGVPIKGLEIAQ